MIEIVLKVLIAYLLGSVSGSLVLGRLKGLDVRNVGSGNAGATNALRAGGWAFALGFGPVGGTVAYVGTREGKSYLVIGAKKSQAYEWVGLPVFSKDGKQVGYGARKGMGILCVSIRRHTHLPAIKRMTVAIRLRQPAARDQCRTASCT